jgi:hypothetical protein
MRVIVTVGFGALSFSIALLLVTACGLSLEGTASPGADASLPPADAQVAADVSFDSSSDPDSDKAMPDASTQDFILGSGKDGALTPTNADFQKYAQLRSNVAKGAIDLPVDDTAGFQPGDLAMILRTTDGDTSTAAATSVSLANNGSLGQYVLVLIKAVDATPGANKPGSVSASSPAGLGGAGGGFIFVRANSIAGAGNWNASGSNGTSGISGGNIDDGAGGGGAGGFIDLRSKSVLTCGGQLSVAGGNGGDTADKHGPGGGGSGGVAILYPSGACAVTTASGNNGNTPADARGAAQGAMGYLATVPAL